MSQRRSARVQAQSHATAAGVLDGHTAEVAALAKKGGRKNKAMAGKATTVSADDGSSTVAANGSIPPMLPPTTPNKRRKVASSPNKPPPMTPTPSAIGLMTSNSVLRPTYSTGDIDDTTPPPVDRPAQPHHTNATLITPRGTQVPPNSSIFDRSPSRPMQEPMTTTTCLLDKAVAHLLKVDPTLKPVIDRNHCRVFSPAGLAETIDPFRSLTSGIIAQQVSGAAAKSIKNKFIGLFPPESCPTGFPPPDIVAETSIPRLREAGLSQRKAEYIQGLAQKFTSGELTIPLLMNGTDEEVMQSLVAVRGLEMFMCFGLKRMDVFSTGDLGVQRGMAAHAGKDVAKLKAKGGGKWKYMAEKEMVERAEMYRPYRSLYMWYMWRVEDVNVEAVGG
ncbi:3-methyladenine DNA glycosylase [Friedmanniomyces endolithicus]|uniref:3-methyladenine DNA glycosylase n=1 Tax=Friedmanniomyces endolithicus TaxID=329885 RepID=A0AAN6L1Z1_9PEZI|nr:3-methyladenine DNA glycosylase [Friedmanniomyces endolithicus]KAK0295120.1 3-methyladenine DNA glycosylase [Friedmanniomyces endolithicus]KAK0317323.1 3-methyladenine DNA glycosylase [Friedmanniomyces endolithicus]KAK0931299.1 3-methyladenine DNA glycosylase [Friedmanniomyces endolithicus]KAK1010448.1 3-methyladenine DNA glycosylase [Friedmanniomyces endolithicus]